MQHADISAVGNDHIHIGAGCNLRCDHFGIHAAGTYIAAGGSFTHIHEFIRKFIHLFDEFRLRILSGIIGVETVNVRQKDQKIRINQRRYNSGQGIVITDLDLVSRYGIIFIDDRDRTHFQQLGKGIVGVVAVQIVHDGIFRHQDLCCYMIILRKQLLIGHHQSRLTDGGACLFHCHGFCLGLSFYRF